ncbi:hypothetical protein CBL_13082 [Carabus blaptoides fortunei]
MSLYPVNSCLFSSANSLFPRTKFNENSRVKLTNIEASSVATSLRILNSTTESTEHFVYCERNFRSFVPSFALVIDRNIRPLGIDQGPTVSCPSNFPHADYDVPTLGMLHIRIVSVMVSHYALGEM